MVSFLYIKNYRCMYCIYISSREIMQNTQGSAGRRNLRGHQFSGCPWNKNAILQSFLARDTSIWKIAYWSKHVKLVSCIIHKMQSNAYLVSIDIQNSSIKMITLQPIPCSTVHQSGSVSPNQLPSLLWKIPWKIIIFPEANQGKSSISIRASSSQTVIFSQRLTLWSPFCLLQSHDKHRFSNSCYVKGILPTIGQTHMIFTLNRKFMISIDIPRCPHHDWFHSRSFL